MKLYRWIRTDDGTIKRDEALSSSHAGPDKQGYPLWLARSLQVTCDALNKDRPVGMAYHYVGQQDGTPVDVPMHDLQTNVFNDPVFVAWRRANGDTAFDYSKVYAD